LSLAESGERLADSVISLCELNLELWSP